MKIIITLIISLVFFLPTIQAQPNNIISARFSYDAAGNRIQRDYGLFLYKNSNPQPVDTFQEESGKEHPNDQIIVRSYPNPVSNTLIIENLNWDDKDKVEVKLYDINGKLILSKPMMKAKDEMPFMAIAVGTYQVHYYINSKLFTTWKIIKL